MNEEREKELREEIDALRREVKRLILLLREASERLSFGDESDSLYCDILQALGK